jgi:Domain of unknown function (DUF4337)
MENAIKPRSGNDALEETRRLHYEKNVIKKLATRFVMESQSALEEHERYAQAVAAAQIAIALGGIAALTKLRNIWILGVCIGLTGLVIISPIGGSVEKVLNNKNSVVEINQLGI